MSESENNRGKVRGRARAVAVTAALVVAGTLVGATPAHAGPVVCESVFYSYLPGGRASAEGCRHLGTIRVRLVAHCAVTGSTSPGPWVRGPFTSTYMQSDWCGFGVRGYSFQHASS